MSEAYLALYVMMGIFCLRAGPASDLPLGGDMVSYVNRAGGKM